MNIQENVSLLKHNTFGIDVNARYYFEYHTEDQLRDFLMSGFLKDKKFLNIGCGSNLLFLKDFDGVALHSNIKDINIPEDDKDTTLIEAGAGVIWDDFVNLCVERSWYGLENLSGIPGTVGASPVQNIGAYGTEAKDSVYMVKGVYVSNSKPFEITAENCEFAYRDSIFKHELKDKVIVTSVIFKLSNKPQLHLDYGAIKDQLSQNSITDPTLKDVRNAILTIRNNKLPDPKTEGNAGSFFKNPEVDKSVYDNLSAQYQAMPHYDLPNGKVKIPAAWMIEQAGWKGKNLGNAAVHDKQALVLVNKGGASGNDIKNLSNEIVKAVHDKFNITIAPEVIWVE